MNNNFVQYVTGMAFCLTLTKPQIKALNGLAFPSNTIASLEFIVCSKVIQALVYKGLIEHNGRDIKLTKPGELTVELLKLAGLIETTKSRKQVVTKGMVKSINEEVSHDLPEHSRSRKPNDQR